ncbi:MAG: VanW family protein [Lachnospiraceae bacterium]|jgi:vancomycin resistance protein YoaR|nr:VanW family protein [Lachnospiraceae bacterium]
MKKLILSAIIALLFVIIAPVQAEAKENTILGGIYVDEVSLGGMTAEEAMAAVRDYVAEVGSREITLSIGDDKAVTVTPYDMGFTWTNPKIILEAAGLGQEGNVIVRYKAIKDLENANQVFALEYDFDTAMIADIIAEEFEIFNVEPVDATMEKVDGEFIITDGVSGYEVDVRASTDVVVDYLDSEWQKDDTVIDLVVKVNRPRGSYEELSQMTDVLGTYTTQYSTGNINRATNVARGAALCNGTLLYPGDEFSTLGHITPFNEANGYLDAGSFLQGQLIDTPGGGICQVSTTLYNAVLLAELEVLERYCHSMTISYVELSFDAAIAESSGKDFRFVNNTDKPVYIEGKTGSGKITFTIYGVEERPSNRIVKYSNEILETTPPTGGSIIQDPGQPIGYVSTSSVYIGYKARLWKTVSEDGAQVSHEQVNSSHYIPVAGNVTVGVAGDGRAYDKLQDAIATGDLEHVKNVAASLAPQPE